jgi:DnaJ-class molecular chaperone
MDDVYMEAFNLGKVIGKLSGTHTYVPGDVAEGKLNLESPVVLAFLEGMGARGERSKHKRFRSSLKKHGIEFEKEPTGRTQECHTCYGKGFRNKYAHGQGYIQVECQTCKGTGTLKTNNYIMTVNGRRLGNA